MESRFFAVGIAVVALAIGGVGCATDGTDSASTDDSLGGAGGTGTEFDDGSFGTGSDVSSQTIGELETVYFEYDQASIRSDSAETLRANAALIKNNDRWARWSCRATPTNAEVKNTTSLSVNGARRP